jgi:hypothetical protein
VYAQGTTLVKKGILPSSLAVSGVKRSEFQACCEIEPIAFESFADVEVVNPADVKIEMALTQLGRVGSDRTNAESASDNRISQHLAFENEVAVRFQMARIVFGPYLAERDSLRGPFRTEKLGLLKDKFSRFILKVGG